MLKAAIPVDLSVRTYQRILQKCQHLKYVKRKHSPCLLPRHKVARMEYATRNVLKPPKWSRIIWSDEKKFNLDGPDGFQYYWHDLRREKHTYFTRNSGGASVMVWGGFSGRGCTQLAFLEGRQNADAYQDTLGNYLFPFGHQHY
ncbi:hypothetical protein AaE_002802, partial [Aphanomyces astaci]